MLCESMSADADINRILDFWLDEIGPKGWWMPDAALDKRVRGAFLDIWDDAMAGRLSHWMANPRGTLALLIILDQFSRNMFRGTPDAFRADPMALRVTKTAITRGQDLTQPEPARMFFYLPLEHSEHLADQARAVRLMMSRLTDNQEFLSHAIQHREVIRLFGRFPSRNKVLGRQDSEAELAYRAQGGYMSGA